LQKRALIFQVKVALDNLKEVAELQPYLNAETERENDPWADAVENISVAREGKKSKAESETKAEQALSQTGD
jgi:hypothetical protein